jgi:hypothetical protein
VRQDRCRVPTRLILAPCSGPSRAWPGHAGARGKASATANLDGPCVRRTSEPAGRGEGTAAGTNKGTAQPWEAIDDMINTLNPPSSARG